MAARHKCSEKVSGNARGDYRDVSGKIYPCARPATVQHDGKWYCWQHDPIRVEADKEKRKAVWNAEADRKAAMWKRRARNAKLPALVTPELPALLERLADYARQAAHAAKGCPDSVDGAYNDEEITRALAARIREVLAQEADGGIAVSNCVAYELNETKVAE